MDEFVKAFRDFLWRDFMYLVAGGATCLAFSRAADVDLAPASTTGWLIGAGIAYGVGYAVQELFGLVRLIRTVPEMAPCWVARFLYIRFERRKWPFKPMNARDWWQRRSYFIRKAKPREYGDFNRIVSLKQVGTALGANGLVCSVLLALPAPVAEEIHQVNWWLVAATAGVSLVLIAMAWVKNLQQVRLIWEWTPPPRKRRKEPRAVQN